MHIGTLVIEEEVKEKITEPIIVLSALKKHRSRHIGCRLVTIHEDLNGNIFYISTDADRTLTTVSMTGNKIN